MFDKRPGRFYSVYTMLEYCKTCPDRGSDSCALPDPEVSKGLSRKLAGALSWRAMELSGAAFLGIPSEATNVSYLNDIRDERDILLMPVEACVVLHQAS